MFPQHQLAEQSNVIVLKEIDRKRLVFHVEVTDNKGRVGIGTHERFIVASEPFYGKSS